MSDTNLSMLDISTYRLVRAWAIACKYYGSRFGHGLEVVLKGVVFKQPFYVLGMSADPTGICKL
jgi:hypothetical protein